MTFAVVSILASIAISVCFVMPVVSTPNFNLATRHKFEEHKLHKIVSSSLSRSSGHRRRHEISRREAEAISTVTDDQSQNICTSDKQREIWQSMVHCQPYPTLVELQRPPTTGSSPNNNIVHMMPGKRSKLFKVIVVSILLNCNILCFVGFYAIIYS